jgi:phenylpropionate dioxygenase-like ring-hydroxylating dioxygenase large terminal subunit
MNVQIGNYRPPAEDAAWLGTDPVPAAPYYDPAYFELERQAIFMRTWLEIGHISEIAEPGSFIRRELEFAKASILIVHGKDGQIRAFHNVCTHRGTQLVTESDGKASNFLCPYHMWNFGFDGQLRSAPDFERFYVTKEECALPQVAVDVCGGFIFVNLDKKPAQSLREFLGKLAERLEMLPASKATTFSEYTYEIDANWKITYDNFQENYHLRFIHPNTGAATFSSDNPFGYPADYGFYGPHRTQTIWTNPTPSIKPIQGFSLGKAMAIVHAQGLTPSPTDRDYFAIFPSLFVLGTPAQHFSHMVYPISATKSRGVIRIYWVGDDQNASQRFAREYVMATVRDVHAEDVEVIKAGQRGLNSGALKHIHFQALESLCRHLFVTVNNMVEAYKAEQPSLGEKS